jgi:hypothetical protein
MVTADVISKLNANPESVIVFVSDINTLHTDFLTVDLDFVPVNDQITHRTPILHNLFINNPDEK